MATMIRFTLSAGNPFQKIEKAWKRNIRARRVVDRHAAIGREAGHGERHRDAVIAGALNGCALESLASFDDHAVLALFHLGAKPPELLGHDRDSVRLLIPQLLGPAN